MSLNMSVPKVSVCVPAHFGMENYDFFMERLVASLDRQTFRDFELVITHVGTMPMNSNAAIKQATGEIIKVLYMDDYLYDENALQHLVDNWNGGWAVSGCVHDDGSTLMNPHFPKWSTDILSGINTLGSPSVLAFENDYPLLFDERMSWMLDLDLYCRLFERYGEPNLINYIDVGIGIHSGQMTQKLTDEEKLAEVKLFHESN